MSLEKPITCWWLHILHREQRRRWVLRTASVRCWLFALVYVSREWISVYLTPPSTSRSVVQFSLSSTASAVLDYTSPAANVVWANFSEITFRLYLRYSTTFLCTEFPGFPFIETSFLSFQADKRPEAVAKLDVRSRRFVLTFCRVLDFLFECVF